MKQLQKGFTLIELMIVVAIIGILAAVAIPAYQDYIGRAQVSEAVTLLGGAKTPLSEYFADKGTFPTNLTDIVTTVSGKYTSAMALTGDMTNVTLTATMATAGVNSALTSKTIRLVSSNGGAAWLCTAGNADAKYLPSACK